MEKAASRLIDHTKLTTGMYIASVDGDITVYELRFCRPNKGPYLSRAAEHTLYHLYEALIANSEYKTSVVWFGASASGSGFHLVTRGMAHSAAIDLVSQMTESIAQWQDEIPSVSEKECSNCTEHDLESAKKWAQIFLIKVKNATQDMLIYPQ